MRVLFTFVGGVGHLDPLIPFARAANAAGHEVAFGCAPALAPTVLASGFPAFAMGEASKRAARRLPLRPVDREREDRDLRERFARRAAGARVPQTVALCGDWQPDVLVCDETDFGAMLAAERLALPYATVLVTATGSFVRAEVVEEPLRALRSAHGLAPDPALEMLRRYLVLCRFPPSLRDPRYPLPATAHVFRPPGPEARPPPAPAWASALPGAPVVYLTLGTVFNVESGDLLARVVGALRALAINLVVTSGHDIDPAELGPQPANVKIERYIPQSSVLPHCRVVVSHGGSGSVLGTLAHGLPSVLIPLGADQPLNAQRCNTLGVAKVLDAASLRGQSVRDAVTTVLNDPAYRRSAERLRNEIAALPDPADAIALLERLAVEKQPLHAARSDLPHNSADASR